MNYKGYTGHVIFDDEAEIFHGEVLGIRAVVTFQGKSAHEIKKAFRDSVDDYLAWCAERGKEPDKPYSGKFNIRLSPALHRKIHEAAVLSGKSLNGWIVDILESASNQTG